MAMSVYISTILTRDLPSLAARMWCTQRGWWCTQQGCGFPRKAYMHQGKARQFNDELAISKKANREEWCGRRQKLYFGHVRVSFENLRSTHSTILSHPRLSAAFQHVSPLVLRCQRWVGTIGSEINYKTLTLTSALCCRISVQQRSHKKQSLKFQKNWLINVEMGKDAVLQKRRR